MPMDARDLLFVVGWALVAAGVAAGVSVAAAAVVAGGILLAAAWRRPGV